VALSALYGDRPEYAEPAILNHRMLLGEDISRTDSLRALGNAYAHAGSPIARAAASKCWRCSAPRKPRRSPSWMRTGADVPVQGR